MGFIENFPFFSLSKGKETKRKKWSFELNQQCTIKEKKRSFFSFKKKEGALSQKNWLPCIVKKTKRGSFKLPSQHIIKNKTKNGEIQALPIENDTKNGVQNCLGNK
jgi:hypothetical protein